MNRPIRLVTALTHPVQYFSPWFRHIAAHCPELDLTVVYESHPTPEQQGKGFDHAFMWDVPLLEGYKHTFAGTGGLGTVIADLRPEAALMFGWYPRALRQALFTCRRLNIPALYRGDTNLLSAPAGWKRSLWRVKNRGLLSQFDAYLSVGCRSRAALLSLGVTPSRVYASPHCVDNNFFSAAADRHRTANVRAAVRARFGLAEDDFVVLFAGKVERKKRPLTVVDAVARLAPGAVLLVAGTGPLDGQCRAEAERLGVRLRSAGFLNQTEIPTAYAAADCLALPSDGGETWGLVVNEAMASGVPCVVSDHVGCGPDLVKPGDTGEIIPLDNPQALADALTKIRKAQRDGHNYGPACRAQVARHSLAAATTGLIGACDDVVNRTKGTRRPSNHFSVPRILVCCGHMVQVSGLERMIFEVLRGQRSRGASVHCVVNSWENFRITELAESIGSSWSAAGYYHTLFLRHSRNPIHFVRGAVDILTTSLGLLRDSLQFRPTHVLLPDFLAVIRNAPALLLLRLLGVPVILRLGNAPESGRFYGRLWRWGINPLVTRFIGNSNFTAAEVLAHGISPDKTAVIYNTVPTRADSWPNATRDPQKVIYVGQLIPNKGAELMLEACRLLVARGRDVRVDIIGSLEAWESPRNHGFREKLRSIAAEPALDGRVRFLGHRDDVPALLAAAAVHCCPSLPEQREAFGLVNIEAKKAAIPTVCFRHGALPELIEHGINGWICDQVSADALADGLEFFLADPDRCRRAGDAALLDAQRFTAEDFATAWNKVFAA